MAKNKKRKINEQFEVHPNVKARRERERKALAKARKEARKALLIRQATAEKEYEDERREAAEQEAWDKARDTPGTVAGMPPVSPHLGRRRQEAAQKKEKLVSYF